MAIHVLYPSAKQIYPEGLTYIYGFLRQLAHTFFFSLYINIVLKCQYFRSYGDSTTRKGILLQEQHNLDVMFCYARCYLFGKPKKCHQLNWRQLHYRYNAVVASFVRRYVVSVFSPKIFFLIKKKCTPVQMNWTMDIVRLNWIVAEQCRMLDKLLFSRARPVRRK